MSPRWFCLSLLLVGCLWVAYSPGSPSSGSLSPGSTSLGSTQESGAAATESIPATLPSTATLPRSYPVLTIQDWCPVAAGKKAPAVPQCKKVIGRADFEELVDGINPKMSKQERRDLVNNYAQVLALAQEALKRGLDKKPRMQAILRYSRLNILAHQMSVELYLEGSATSPEDVEKYYANHQAEFELYTVERIFIPKEKQGQTMSLNEAQREISPSSEGEMKSLAEGTQASALAGADFTALQDKVFHAAGINTPAKVDMEIGPESLSAAQQGVLDLAPGKVSPLFTDTTGYYIYKMVSKQVPALDSIREQVKIRMTNKRTSDLIGKIHAQAQPKINDAYFDKYDPPPPDPNEPDLDTD